MILDASDSMWMTASDFGLQHIAVIPVFITAQILLSQNDNTWNIFFSDWAEIFTREVFEVKKFTGNVSFACFCHFRGKKWDQMSKFLLLDVEFGPVIFISDFA